MTIQDLQHITSTLAPGQSVDVDTGGESFVAVEQHSGPIYIRTDISQLRVSDKVLHYRHKTPWTVEDIHKIKRIHQITLRHNRTNKVERLYGLAHNGTTFLRQTENTEDIIR